MDFHIHEYYQKLSDKTSTGKFHDVIPLHSRSDLSWEEVCKLVPQMPKGWYELARIPAKTRIDFTFDLWNSILPFRPKLEKCLEDFFNSLDDIGLFIVQKTWEDPFIPQMVYSIHDNGGFYRGGLPLTEAMHMNLTKAFPNVSFPADFIAFLKIHNGFWKTTDCTGIVLAENLPNLYQEFQRIVSAKPPITIADSRERVNPRSLFPFYESFGMPYFQCFWSEWYPEQEMGNVYYSSETNTISNVKNNDSSETMAFPSFSEWLAFYLERVD